MNGKYDLIIIGGGAAGFAAAVKADELGAKTLMVNSGLPIGGTCVNIGCVPTNFLIHIAQMLYNGKNNRIKGIDISVKEFNFSEVIQSDIQLVEIAREEKYVKVLKNLKNVEFVEGKAEFISPKEIRIGDRTFRGEKFILAVGSKTTVPPIDGLKETGFITHIEALTLKEQPKELVIIDEGHLGSEFINSFSPPLGIEFGQLFSRFGTKVTFLEPLDSIFSLGERSIVKLLEKILVSEGIDIKTNAKAKKVFRKGDKKVLIYEIDGKEEMISTDEILIASRKTPNTDGMNLEAVGVKLDKRKAIVVNEFLQTTVEHIYAAGDCANLPLRLETTAAREGTIAAENALTGSKKSIDYLTVPYTIHTDPELAGVGITQEDAIKKYGECSCSLLKLTNVPNAMIKNRTEGAIKMVIHPKTLQVIGVHILAPNASELIAQATLIIKNKMTVNDVIEALPVFPTFSEVIRLCALSFTKNVSKLPCCV